MRGHRQHAALIDAWFDLMPQGQQATARELHTIVRTAAPQWEMSVRGGNLVYAWRGAHVLALAPFRSHMHVQVFRGGAMTDRFPELEGSGRGLRQIRIRHGAQFDALLVDALVRGVAADAVSFEGERR